MSENVTPATGRYVTDGVPHGTTSLTPHIVVSPAAESLDFYTTVFGATVDEVTRFGDQIAHAELDFGNGRLTLSDPLDNYGLAAPDPSSGADYSLAVYVRDVDAVMARAVTAGATVREAVTTFVTGDRFGSVLDPFGVRWTIMTRVEDISPEESKRRVAEWAVTQ